MNLYAVFVNGEQVAEIIARSAMSAFYKMQRHLKIRFRRGVKILELVSGWCSGDTERA